MVLPMEPTTGEHRTDDLVEDYLDHLCAPLVGLVPYGDRRLLRSEAAFVIEQLARDAMLEGLEPEAATLRAIQRYGDSQDLSERFLSEWTRRRERGRLARLLGLPRLYASFFFGQATVWGLVWGPRLSPAFLAYALVVPALAGALTGRCAPTTSFRDTVPITLVCTLSAAVAALLALPEREGALLPALQLLWWLPLGGFAAQATSALTRRQLLRFHPRSS